jgi:hypothetical protein
MLPARCTLQFSRELDPLRFATGEFCRRLTQPDISKPNLLDHIKGSRNVGVLSEEGMSRIDSHRQDVFRRGGSTMIGGGSNHPI